MINKSAKVYVAGHNGMVGSAIVEALEKTGYDNIVTAQRGELDLRNQQEVLDFMDAVQPKVVIIAAARVGGIKANNDYPYQFLYDNLMIESNLINAAHRKQVQDLIFLGSSCVYPKLAPQPLKEEYLLSGPLEPTNQWYAVAKISGIKLCQALNRQYGRNYISLMPTNLYGPGDNFDLETSHVLPAMIRKFHDAKMEDHRPVPLWGTGAPLREFLHVSDLADAIRFLMENSASGLPDLINIGTGKDLSIRDLATTVQTIVGHKGDILWDETKPDGTPRKLMDVSLMSSHGWEAAIELEEGLKLTYDWFLKNQSHIRKTSIQSDKKH